MISAVRAIHVKESSDLFTCAKICIKRNTHVKEQLYKNINELWEVDS